MLNRRQFLISSAALAASGCVTTGDSQVPISGVRLGILSDTHYQGSANDTDLRNALLALKAARVDALLHCGDVTDIGLIDEYAGFMRVWNEVMGEDTPLIIAWGNRDLADTKSIPPERLRREAGRFMVNGKLRGNTGIRCCSVKGVNIVAADWKREGELESFMFDRPELRDPTRPLVVIQHPCMQSTVFDAKGWMSDDARAGCYLRMYPNAIAFCGHTHIRFSVPESIWQKDFTVAAAGSYHLPPCRPKIDQNTMDGREISVLTVTDDRYCLERRDLKNGYSETRTFYHKHSLPSPARQTGEFTFVQWNLGHFNFGRSGYTQLDTAAARSRVENYRRGFAALNADFMALCEYDCTMDVEGKLLTKTTLLKDCASVIEGPHQDYNCNTLAARDLPLEKLVVRDFANSQHGRYYLAAETRCNGERVVLVASHLHAGSEGAEQLAELVNTFRHEPRVIVSADFNVADESAYQSFYQAGFKGANFGRFGIFATHRRRRMNETPAIDNVFVRGFDFIDVRTADLPMLLSDHRPLVCRLRLSRSA